MSRSRKPVTPPASPVQVAKVDPYLMAEARRVARPGTRIRSIDRVTVLVENEGGG